MTLPFSKTPGFCHTFAGLSQLAQSDSSHRVKTNAPDQATTDPNESPPPEVELQYIPVGNARGEAVVVDLTAHTFKPVSGI